MWDRHSLERELDELGVREYQLGPVGLPVQKIRVRDWWDVPVVNLTVAATPDNVTIQGPEKVNPLLLDRPKRMWIRAGDHARHRRGEVVINLTIEYDKTPGSASSSMLAPARFEGKVLLKFLCTAEGGIWLDRGSPPRRSLAGYDLGVTIEVYQRKDKPKQRSPMRGIPPSVWDEWMKTFRIFRIVMVAKLTRVARTGTGSFTVDFKDPSVRIPDPIVASSTDLRTAQVGPMIIDLVPEDARPPITAKQGIVHNVYFEIGSSELDKVVKEPDGRIHQGNKLDAWIRDNLIGRWDVHEALLRGDLPVRGEARASAALKGIPKSPQEAFRYLKALPDKRREQEIQRLLAYNLGLSERRRDAIVNRLKGVKTPFDRSILLRSKQIEIKAIGAGATLIPGWLANWIGVMASGSGLGEETVNERRCDIRIDAADLDKAIKQVYKVHRWHWDR
jgi:hypothetical protein